MKEIHQWEESEFSVIGESVQLQGQIDVNGLLRFHGRIRGKLRGTETSEIIIAPTGAVDGEISGGTVRVDGFVEGNIVASKLIVLNSKARVLGNLSSPNMQIEPGAHFDGKAIVEPILG